MNSAENVTKLFHFLALLHAATSALVIISAKKIMWYPTLIYYLNQQQGYLIAGIYLSVCLSARLHKNTGRFGWIFQGTLDLAQIKGCKILVLNGISIQIQDSSDSSPLPDKGNAC